MDGLELCMKISTGRNGCWLMCRNGGRTNRPEEQRKDADNRLVADDEVDDAMDGGVGGHEAAAVVAAAACGAESPLRRLAWLLHGHAEAGVLKVPVGLRAKAGMH